MQEYSRETRLDKLIQELAESCFFSKRKHLYKFIIEAAEKPLIERVLLETEGNQLQAAKILGINRNTLRSKIKKLGITIK